MSPQLAALLGTTRQSASDLSSRRISSWLRYSFSTSISPNSRIKPTTTTIRSRPTQPQHREPSPLKGSEGIGTASSPTPSNVSRIVQGKTGSSQQPYYERLHRDRVNGSDQQRHQQKQQHPGFNSLFHLSESRRVAIRAFLVGTVVTLAGSGAYKYSTSSGWQFQQAYLHARSSLVNSSSSSTKSEYPPSPDAGLYSFFPLSGPPRFEKQLKMLTPEQVEQQLTRNQLSFKVATQDSDRKNRPKQEVILGYCINQVASNNPIEDDLSCHAIRGEDGEIEKVFFGVFDGHGGWCCSQKVAQELAPTVAMELEHVKDPHDVIAVMDAIENGFLKLDHKIVNETVQQVLESPSRPLACSSLLPAIAGSCALMAYVDIKERDLYVACTGDSRAVLGVRQPSDTKDGHSWSAVPLSFDQTGRNRWEVRRLQEEHPGEENTVVMRGRVLGGLEPTRAFGDARYKWTLDIQERVFRLFPSYRQPHRNYHTPPYVTAKPVVKHHKLRPEDQFLVMATDGLWDKLTSDEVIQLVGALVDGKKGQEQSILDRKDNKISTKVKAMLGTVTGKRGDQNEEETELTPANLAPKGPISQVRQFTFKDPSNASTHLVRNALGGGDDDKLAATLSIPAPMSRVYRDDITVTVIFFGNQDSTFDFLEASDSDGFVDI